MGKYAIIRLDKLGEEDAYYKDNIKHVRELFTSVNDFIEYEHDYTIITLESKRLLDELLLMASKVDKEVAVSLYRRITDESGG